MENVTCSADGCEKSQMKRGRYCSMHRARLDRRGSLELPAEYPGKPRPLTESLWSKVDKTEGCWNWSGAKTDRGYGQIRRSKKVFYVHRLSYEIHKGAIPDGMEVDHVCRNRLCVNPEHLRTATRKQNMENIDTVSVRAESGVRGVAKGKNGRWRAEASHFHQKYIAGSFDDIDQAAEAAVALRLSLHTHNAQDRAREAE